MALRLGRRTDLPQRLRLWIAGAYLAGLLALGLYLNDQFFPPFGISGLWFYSAFAALILGDFLLEPFFTRPADAMANGVALIVGAASVSLVGVQISSDAATAGRYAFISLGVLIIVAAAIAIVLKDADGFRRRAARWASLVAGRLGRSRSVWSLVLFAVGYAAFADDAGKVAALYVTWVQIFVVEPLERATGLIHSKQPKVEAVGRLERIEDPGIAVVRLNQGTPVELGAAATFGSGTATGVVVDVAGEAQQPVVRVALEPGGSVTEGMAVHLGPAQGEVVVGHVGEGTNLEDLQVETASIASKGGLAEGRLVSAAIEDKSVLYQVTQATIASEKNELIRRDFVRVTARKLGVWDEERTTFEQVTWVPAPGSAVRIPNIPGAGTFNPNDVGHVPATDYGIRIDLDRAVTHNTAVLGILGVGKTHLSWELVRRMLAAGIKVVVLDITGQYSVHLADICSPETEQGIVDALNAKIAPNLTKDLVRDGQAGNFRDLEAAIDELLSGFMAADERLLILNPNRIKATRMEGKPYSGKANFMVPVTMVEITQMVSETLLRVVEGDFTESARVCLVLEEAHSLIPEWNSVVHEGEKAAVNGTARAILQGRKFGFGCMLITQRTANVTKSILNQCNTIFGLRIYDATGMGFLENYIGRAHAHILATLPDRQAVVFGRASSCNAPIIVRLNDTESFNAGYWEPSKTEVPVTAPPPEEADGKGEEVESEADLGPTDDPPF